MKKIKAAIIDLDGVITQTATTHAMAWKQMFDAYNQKRKEKGEMPYREFSIEEDYFEYLDGMPRYDGVKNFLQSRNISLPWGNAVDDPDKETICGLGNWKNVLFNELLKKGEVKIFEKNVAKLREWKAAGIRLAVISSSTNCRQVLELTGLESIFEARVDGVVSEERKLKGKPAPDIFLEAAKELNTRPDEALIVEDSRAGVEAGRKGGFQRVIGIGGKEQMEIMKKLGATEVVESLEQLDINKRSQKAPEDLPSALENFDRLAGGIGNEGVVLCLDYDGTLTPIVADYTKAIISDKMREQVRKAAAAFPVAIISGRDIFFIKEKVNLDGIFYAGSHGFEIEGPDNFRHELKEAEALLPVLDDIENKLNQELKQFKGVKIERKKYALAVHYRNASEADVPAVNLIIDKVLSLNNKIEKGRGKKVIELKPRIKWNKGKAVEMIAKQLGAEMIIYIGDDVTDEDAFRSITNGVGILAGTHDEPFTAADYSLRDVDEVQEFLKKLSENL
ncbi:MAG: trehalose-phosphatase [Bacteroidia bacterium]